MSDYSVQQIAFWRRQTQDAQLENRDILDKYSDEQLAGIFNGIGPDRFPSWLRWLISKLHPSLMAVAMIHDTEWYERQIHGAPSTETEDKNDFHSSNARFKRNGYRMAKFRHSAMSIERYVVEFDAWKFSLCCNTSYGFESWQS